MSPRLLQEKVPKSLPQISMSPNFRNWKSTPVSKSAVWTWDSGAERKFLSCSVPLAFSLEPDSLISDLYCADLQTKIYIFKCINNILRWIPKIFYLCNMLKDSVLSYKTACGNLTVVNFLFLSKLWPNMELELRIPRSRAASSPAEPVKYPCYCYLLKMTFPLSASLWGKHCPVETWCESHV